MSDLLTFLLLIVVLLAPFAMVATLASRAHRGGYLRWHLDQFRFAAPMAGRVFGDEPDPFNDADLRRSAHEIEAIRSRFEEHPAWPRSGALGERR